MIKALFLLLNKHRPLVETDSNLLQKRKGRDVKEVTFEEKKEDADNDEKFFQ